MAGGGEGEKQVTVLSKRKTRAIVEFSDAVREKGKLREVVMILSPYGLSVRLKGMRTAFEVSPASVYNLAVVKHVNAPKAEKAKAKKGRK
jgi:hypothetical protein